MFYVLLGCLGFAIFCLFEIVSLRGGRFLKWLVLLSGGLLVGFSFTRMCFGPPKFYVPSFVSWPSWFLAAVFFFLFIYSNFLEIPFRQTYVDRGVGTGLVKTGTYALTRHPGVLWTSLMMAFLILATGSKWLLIGAPVWLLMDLAWVWLQDTFYFERMFPGYKAYRRETPMLIPNRESIKRCLSSLGRSESVEGGGRHGHSRRDLADR